MLQLVVGLDARFSSYQIVFKDLDSYLLDTLLCYTHAKLLEIAQQVKPNNEPKHSPSLVLFVNDLTDRSAEIKNILCAGFEQMIKDFSHIGALITAACSGK